MHSDLSKRTKLMTIIAVLAALAALMGLWVTGQLPYSTDLRPASVAAAKAAREVKAAEDEARDQRVREAEARALQERDERLRQLHAAADKAFVDGGDEAVFQLLLRHSYSLDPVLTERFDSARAAVIKRVDKELDEGKFDEVFDLLRPNAGSLGPELEQRYTRAAQGVVDANAKRAWAGAEANAKAKAEAEAADNARALQRWDCDGMLRSVDIWSIPGSTANRRVRMIYSSQSITTDEYVSINRAGNRTIYRTDPERNDYFVVTGDSNLRFYEDGRRMSGDEFSSCRRL